jgi:hypothetical protein
VEIFSRPGFATGFARPSILDTSGGDWGDGAAFLDRPEHSGQLVLNGASDMVIEDYKFTNRPYVQGQGNAHVCIRILNCTNITVRYCDFDTISQPFEISGGENITIEWCRAQYITGPHERFGTQNGNFVQTHNTPDDVTVQDNLIRANGDTEDIISLYSTQVGLIARNTIEGTGWESGSGTGIILGDGGGTEQVAEDNTLLNPGQVGIGIAGGTNHTVQRNTIYQWSDHPNPGNSNVGMYAVNYHGGSWSGHAFLNNHVRFWSDSQGVPNGLYNPDGFTSSGNNLNDSSIDPEDLEVVL